MSPIQRLSPFARAYLETAIWAGTDDNDKPLDERFSLKDVAPVALDKIAHECEQFLAEHVGLISSDLEQAGHDFYLTRNGHGAGFWDGDWPEETGEILTTASERFGESQLYVGDDGMLYVL